MRMTRRKRRAYDRLQRRTTMNGRAESDPRNVECVARSRWAAAYRWTTRTSWQWSVSSSMSALCAPQNALW
jgi:hypothetical protein